VRDDAQGVASGIVSAAAGVGASVGLAILVVVANRNTLNVGVPDLQAAEAAGIRKAVFSIGGGIIAMSLLPVVGLRRRAS